MINVLYVTNMFPSEWHVYSGIHIKEQIESIQKLQKVRHETFVIEGGKSRLNYVKSLFLIPRLIRQGNYDIVHIHFGLSGLFLLLFRSCKTPIILTLHGSDTMKSKLFGFMHFISKYTVGRSQRTIVVSEKMKELFPKNEKKIETVPCGVNLDSFGISPKRGFKPLVIGFAGDKDRPGKNYKLFDEIVKDLSRQGYDVAVSEIHNLTREHVANVLAGLDCLLVTSLYEGSPQIVKEAMASGTPIVSSDVGDVAKLLNGVENCYVVPSFDKKDYLQAIIKIFELAPSQRISKGKDKLIELGLDSVSISKKVLTIYQSVLNEA